MVYETSHILIDNLENRYLLCHQLALIPESSD